MNEEGVMILVPASPDMSLERGREYFAHLEDEFEKTKDFFDLRYLRDEGFISFEQWAKKSREEFRRFAAQKIKETR